MHVCKCIQAEMGGRAARTRAALDAMDPAQRLALEGHRPGAYLRLRFTGARARQPPRYFSM
jgi:ribosome biogenesis protein BMS1